MKQKFTRPDGTQVEVEGTAEELAAYERALSQGREAPVSETPAQRRVLTEQVSRIAKALEEMREEQARRPLEPPRVVERWFPVDRWTNPYWEWYDWNRPLGPKITWEVSDFGPMDGVAIIGDGAGAVFGGLSDMTFITGRKES